jgi:hypothetical protein
VVATLGCTAGKGAKKKTGKKGTSIIAAGKTKTNYKRLNHVEAF